MQTGVFFPHNFLSAYKQESHEIQTIWQHLKVSGAEKLIPVFVRSLLALFTPIF